MTSKSVPPKERVLNAAQQLFLSHGIEGPGMQEVAEAAGMARSTLYRYYASRDEVLIALVQRDMLDMATLLQKRLARFSDPAEHLVEGLVIAIHDIPKRPLLNAVFATDEASRVRRAVWNSSAIVELGESFMADVITPARELNLLSEDVSPEVLVEWVYRILISYLTLPSNHLRSKKQLRATLHALLVPVILKR